MAEIKYIAVRGAEPIGDQVIGPVNITISGHFPSQTKEDLARLRQSFKEDAEKLFQALLESLPGGTFCQLLALMLQEKASHFIVSHKQPSKYQKMEAASEMYAALEGLLKELHDGVTPLLHRGRPGAFDVCTMRIACARKALAKARGESEGQDV